MFSRAERIEFQKEISSSNFTPESRFTLVFNFVSLFRCPFCLNRFNLHSRCSFFIVTVFTYIDHVFSNGLIIWPESPKIYQNSAIVRAQWMMIILCVSVICLMIVAIKFALISQIFRTRDSLLIAWIIGEMIRLNKKKPTNSVTNL